jgi:head-tail adaptor
VSVGLLGDRVTFQRRVVTNVGGVGQETWPNLPAPRYPAYVVSSAGRQELLIDGNVQTQTARRYTVRVRVRGDVQTDDRCVYHHPSGDRLLQILGIAESDDARWIDIEALEVRA